MKDWKAIVDKRLRSEHEAECGGNALENLGWNFFLLGFNMKMSIAIQIPMKMMWITKEQFLCMKDRARKLYEEIYIDSGYNN